MDLEPINKSWLEWLKKNRADKRYRNDGNGPVKKVELELDSFDAAALPAKYTFGRGPLSEMTHCNTSEDYDSSRRLDLNKIKGHPELAGVVKEGKLDELHHGDLLTFSDFSDNDQLWMCYGDPKNLALVKTIGPSGELAPVEFFDAPTDYHWSYFPEEDTIKGNTYPGPHILPRQADQQIFDLYLNCAEDEDHCKASNEDEDTCLLMDSTGDDVHFDIIHSASMKKRNYRPHHKKKDHCVCINYEDGKLYILEPTYDVLLFCKEMEYCIPADERGHIPEGHEDDEDEDDDEDGDDDEDDDDDDAPKKKKGTGSAVNFSGKTLVFTGTLKVPRAQATQKAEAAGAKVTGSISKNTDFLVMGTGVGSKKQDAINKGVSLLTEAEFLAAVGGGGGGGDDDGDDDDEEEDDSPPAAKAKKAPLKATKVASTGTKKASSSGKVSFDGKTVVFTGTLDMKRTLATAMATKAGANVTGSISGNTDFLVCGAAAGSKKALAEAKGVTCLTEAEFVLACRDDGDGDDEEDEAPPKKKAKTEAKPKPQPVAAATKSIATWYWKKDEDAPANKGWERYDDKTQATIEKAYSASKTGKVVLPPSGDYQINFKKMIQHRVGDEYRQRDVKREE